MKMSALLFAFLLAIPPMVTEVDAAARFRWARQFLSGCLAVPWRRRATVEFRTARRFAFPQLQRATSSIRTERCADIAGNAHARPRRAFGVEKPRRNRHKGGCGSATAGWHEFRYGISKK